MDLEEEAARNVQIKVNAALKDALGSFVADAVFSPLDGTPAAVKTPEEATQQTSFFQKRKSDQINNRDSRLAKDGLPAVGSFDLIKDLVREFTVLRVRREKENNKRERDSLRLYAGTKLAKDAVAARERQEVSDYSQMRSTSEWGNEQLSKKHTLFRQKGLRDTSTTGRFVTSTKP